MTEPLRLLVVGASSSPTCGVRAHAAALAPALRAAGAGVDTAWWERDAAWDGRRTRRSAAAHRAQVTARLRIGRPHAVVWHYSAFEYGSRTEWDLRGLPVHAPGVARRVRGSGSAVVVVLHEAAYSFSEPGVQRKVLAAGQRAALVPVLEAAAGAVLATEPRRRWIQSRRWLPRRPLTTIPVCAPAGDAPAGRERGDGRQRVGVLGFGADDARADLLTAAVAALRRDGREVELVLLGAPGDGGERAERWRRAAERAGCAASLSFSGVLEAGELARRLAAVDVVALPHAAGPASNKTSLGAALAAGAPVIGFDGPEAWRLAARRDAVLLSEPTAAALGRRLEALLGDPAERRRRSLTAREFARREMSPEAGAARLLAFVRSVT